MHCPIDVVAAVFSVTWWMYRHYSRKIKSWGKMAVGRRRRDDMTTVHTFDSITVRYGMLERLTAPLQQLLTNCQ
jgi:hypothetical protein